MSIIINNWRMDPSLNALIHCETGETRRLGEYHFILLETLAKNADVVLSRSYLCAEVWKNRIVGGNSLPTAIHALRVAIDDDGKQQNCNDPAVPAQLSGFGIGLRRCFHL